MALKPVITILKNGETILEQVLEGEVILGRAEDCGVTIDDRAISRKHLFFTSSDTGLKVEKQSKFASMLVNGGECEQVSLNDGDIINVGPYIIKVRFDKKEKQEDVAKAEEENNQEIEGQVPGDDSDQEVDENLNLQGESDLSANKSEEKNEFSGLEEDSEADKSNELDGGNLNIDSSGDPLAEGEEAFSGQPDMEEEFPDLGDADDGETKISSAEELNVQLIFPDGAANVTEYDITQEKVIIGRSKKCDIVIQDKKSSRQNTLIQKLGVRFFVKDLDSSNGTYVNGVKVSEQELSGEDIVRIGDTEFQFKAINLEYKKKEQGFMDIPDEVIEEPLMDDLAAGGQELQVANDQLGLEASDGSEKSADGLGGIDGLAGVGGAGSAKKQTLVEKFRALPKSKQIIYGGVGLFLILTLLESEPEKKKIVTKEEKPKKEEVKKDEKLARTFENLDPEKKKFVESQHSLAFDFYRNKEYDKSLYAISQIFDYVDDYKDSREIERYAKEGKRKLEAIEEEKRKADEEKRLKAKLAQLAEEARQLMSKDSYDLAGQVFTQILELDPENAQVAKWQRIIDDFNERKKLEAQQKKVQEEINQIAKDTYDRGIKFYEKEKFHKAIEILFGVPDTGTSDQNLVDQSREKIEEIKGKIKEKLDPVVAQALQLEESGEMSKAFKLFQEATKIDSKDKRGYEGMDRIRSILHERAKRTYTEAIIAESYSDFLLAKQKFQEVIELAPQEDIYYTRAKRKLAKYFHLKTEENN